jgi:hypothetical protein
MWQPDLFNHKIEDEVKFSRTAALIDNLVKIIRVQKPSIYIKW